MRLDPLSRINCRYVCERATVVLRHLPESIRHPIRLEDDSAAYAAEILLYSPNQEASDVLYLYRIYSVVKAEHAMCWMGRCKSLCTIWDESARHAVEEQLVMIRNELAAESSADRVNKAAAKQYLNRRLGVLWLLE